MTNERESETVVSVRDATDTDIAAILKIYAEEVLHGLATFEEVPPSLNEMTGRWRGIHKAGFPYLVAEVDGRVVGFGYASTYRPRPAYRHCVENTVYVASGSRGFGVGRAIVETLIARCENGGWRQMVAIIGDVENTGSRALHQALGFREVGILRAVGFKLGQWVDSVIMQRELGNGSKTPPDQLPSTVPRNEPLSTCSDKSC